MSFINSAQQYKTICILGDTNRGLCECDRELMNFLKTAPARQSTKAECEKGGGTSKLECCNWNDFQWATYNPAHSCCDSIVGVRQAGEC